MILPSLVLYESAKRGASFKRAFARQLKKAAKEASASPFRTLLESVARSPLHKNQPLVAANGSFVQLNPHFEQCAYCQEEQGRYANGAL